MNKKRLILIILSVLILLGCISMTGVLLFSNFRNVRLFKQAQNNFQRGDKASLSLAEAQLLQLIRNDGENETAFVMLGDIARRKKIYPEQVYYCFMAYRLNPLSTENREKYIESLCFAHYFDRLETFLAQQTSSADKHYPLLLYAAGRNGNISKYKHQLPQQNNVSRIGELAILLFKDENLSSKQKLSALNNFKPDDDFLKQAILTAQTELYLAENDIDNAEKCLLQAYELNQYAFAPALGRFYSNYRNLGKALKVFEKHLSVYHDQSVAMQTAEIYCLLNQTDKIVKLRTDYQSDSGSRAMLCNYYFDALIALTRKDMAALQELTIPLRKNINTPLAAFMFFCADVRKGDSASVLSSYNTLLAHRNYLDLQTQADNILSGYLKKTFAENRTNYEKLLPLAEALYKRKPEVFTAKLMLLAQKKTNSVNIILLKDALKRFSSDDGIIKIAIEYYLHHGINDAERLISFYKHNFVQKSADMLRYDIILNMQKKDYEKVSELFRKNCSAELMNEYWNFASSSMREKDLLFLSADKLYGPFSKALLAIKKNDKKTACDLLEKADAANNHALLFFAAKTLAENGYNQAALKKYALFPKESAYKIAVMLNTAELYAEEGDSLRSLILAEKAYNAAPQMPETQLCYADKLYKIGNLKRIPDIIKLTSSNTYSRKLKKLWLAGMQQRLKDCDINTRQEKIRELCRQILIVDKNNTTALELLKKLQKIPQ